MMKDKLFRAVGDIDDKWILAADDADALLAAAHEKKIKKSKRHFVGYELGKLLGVRYIWIFLLVLLLLNSAIAWYSAGLAGNAEDNRMISEFFDSYFDSPEEFDAHYEKILAFNEEQLELMHEAIRAGDEEFTLQEFPDVYSQSDKISDEQLFAILYSAIEKAEEHPETVRGVIDSAELNLASFADLGIGENDFGYRYQTRVIELYGAVLDGARLGVEHSHGWEDYFGYEAVNIFISIMIIIVSAVVFAQEKHNGFLPVLRSTRKGRLTAAVAKLLTLVTVSTVTVLLFTATTFAVYGMRLGYSSPMNAIQSMESFALSPYCITVGEFFAITVGLKILTFVLLSLCVAAVSVIFSNYAVIFVGGFSAYGVSFLLYSSERAAPALRLLNIVGVSSVGGFFERYRALNIFGNVCGFLPFIIIVFTILTAACGIFCTVMHVRGFAGIRFAFVDALKAELMIRRARLGAFLKSRREKKTRGVRSYTSSLISAEIFKTLISSRFIIAVLLLLCVKIGYSAEIYRAPVSYSDKVYREYMTVLEGELTDEKLAFIENERAEINRILRANESMGEAYREKRIGFDEYQDYLSQYNYASSRDKLLLVIEEHALYLQGEGEGGWFVYDTGWRNLYSGDADLFLYTAILLLLAGIFASEYFSRGSKGGFARILRSTKRGRENTFTAKLCSAAIMSLSLTLLMSAVDLVTVFSNYEMPAMSAPLVSIRMFGSVSADITIGRYLVVFILLRMVGALLMAMLVCALSELLCRYLPVLGTVILLTLLPALCAALGISAAEPINFLNLLAGTPIVLQSAEASLFGSDWGMLAIWVAAASVAVGGIMMPAKKMFVK